MSLSIELGRLTYGGPYLLQYTIGLVVHVSGVKKEMEIGEVKASSRDYFFFYKDVLQKEGGI